MQLALTTAASITVGVCIFTLVGCLTLLAVMWLPQHADEPADTPAGNDDDSDAASDALCLVAERARTADETFAHLAGATPVVYDPPVEPDTSSADPVVAAAAVATPPAPAGVGVWMQSPVSDADADLEAAFEVRRICRAAIDEYEQDADRACRDAAAAEQAAARLDAEADAAEQLAVTSPEAPLWATARSARDAAVDERRTAGVLRDVASAHQRDAAALRVQLARIEANLISGTSSAAPTWDAPAARPSTAGDPGVYATPLPDHGSEIVDAPDTATGSGLPAIVDASLDGTVVEAPHANQPDETGATAAPAPPDTVDGDLTPEPAPVVAPDFAPVVAELALPAEMPSPLWPAPHPGALPHPATLDPALPAPAPAVDPVMVIAPQIVEPTAGEFGSDIADAARLAIAASHALPAGVTYAELELIEVPEPPVDVSAAFDPDRWSAPAPVITAPFADVDVAPPASVSEDLVEDEPVSVSPRHAARQARAARRAAQVAAKAAAKAAARRRVLPQPVAGPDDDGDVVTPGSGSALVAQPDDPTEDGPSTLTPWRDDSDLIALLDTLDATPDDGDDEVLAPVFEPWSLPDDDAVEPAGEPWRSAVNVFDDDLVEASNDPGEPDRPAAGSLAETQPAAWNEPGPAPVGLGAGSSYDPDVASVVLEAPAAAGRRGRRAQRRAERQQPAVQDPTIAGFSRPGAFGDDAVDSGVASDFAELVSLPTPTPLDDEPVDAVELTGIPGGDIDDLLADTRPIGPAGHLRVAPTDGPEPVTATLDVPLTVKQARKQAAEAARQAKRDAAERRRLERRARRAGVAVDDSDEDSGSEPWQSPSWVAEPLEIKPVVTPGDTVDYALYDLPEPIPDRAASLEVDERVAAMVDVPIGKASVRWQNDPT